jgi:putative ATPase
MLVMASEDVGMADPNALPIVLACVQAAERVGLPEARYPLSQAAIYLALAPKSNSIGRAFNAARDDIHAGRATIVPEHIASEHPRDYVYPHNFPNHWVNQQYMPDDLLGKHYWIPDKVKQEQIRAEYWARVKKDAS